MIFKQEQIKMHLEKKNNPKPPNKIGRWTDDRQMPCLHSTGPNVKTPARICMHPMYLYLRTPVQYKTYAHR